MAQTQGLGDGLHAWLVKLFDLALDDGRAYYLCLRNDGELTREGVNFYNWIRTRF